MFARLMKHEWKANSGLFGILTLAILGVGIAATVVLRILVNHAPQLMAAESGLGGIAVFAMGSFLFFCGIALFLYLAAVGFVLLYRFYKNKFTDEGYLTFTLPVKPTAIFWSSVVNILLWGLISGLVTVAVLAMVLLLGTGTDSLVNTDILQLTEIIKPIISLIGGSQIFETPRGIIFLVEAVLQALLTPIYSLFVALCCITVGAVIAKKHKILAAFGIYYGVSMVVGIITSVLSFIPTVMMSGTVDVDVLYLINSGVQLLLTALITVGAYFVTIHLMKNKLNLP